MLCILGTLIALMAVIWFSFVYVTDYKKTTCDITTSPERKHELILKEDENKISQTDFELWNDGGSISSGSWKVTWYDGYVEVILSEEEQVDEQVILQFDGKKEFQQLFDEE